MATFLFTTPPVLFAEQTILTARFSLNPAFSLISLSLVYEHGLNVVLRVSSRVT